MVPVHAERLQPRPSPRGHHVGGVVQEHELALREPAAVHAPEKPRLQRVPLMRARGVVVLRGGDEQNRIRVSRARHAPSARKRIRL